MSEDVIDLNEFLERVMNDKELLLELLDLFIEEFQEKRKLLGAAIENKNFEQIKSATHSLKGSSGNISAKSLRVTVIQIEKMGVNNDLTGAQEALGDLDKKYDALLGRINDLKEEFK
jgi:HPt (histidine-containing phosphotransfer) domain-containing protein